MSIKQFILKNKILGPIALAIRGFPESVRLYKKTKRILKDAKNQEKRIFYIGVPAHCNLGDLAQGVCIRKWLKKHYSDYAVIEIETDSLVGTIFSCLKRLKKIYRENDFIVFQSGYTTTDLGGRADEMHRAVMNILPKAKMLMMPQTIYFKKEENKKRTSQVYNSMQNMLFLARDNVSYKMAREMFPDISVECYPDIVTTMIGNYNFNYNRKGIIFCCRDDGEKFYTNEQIDELMERCSAFTNVTKTDTTKLADKKAVLFSPEKHIIKEIDNYAHYKIVITDRYHGTIFSLAAGTPVIIIKTTDHKVTTGADWFKGVYDDYVYLAEDLNQAYDIAKKLYFENLSNNLESYFEREYYDKLPHLYDERV